MSTYDEMIRSMPVGLERAVLRILSYRRGAEKAIRKQELIRELGKLGFSEVNERQVRLAINTLRKNGNLIGSSAGRDAGYYLLAGWNELDDFLRMEIDSRIQDLASTKKAMTEAASTMFGEKPLANQERLF